MVVFAVSLLIGGAAINVAAKYAVYQGKPGGLTFEHAVVTALLGAVVWALLAWIPLVVSLLALAGWVGVIRWRYPGGWIRAAVTGAAAWAAAVVVLAVLELLGIGSGRPERHAVREGLSRRSVGSAGLGGHLRHSFPVGSDGSRCSGSVGDGSDRAGCRRRHRAPASQGAQGHVDARGGGSRGRRRIAGPFGGA